MFDAHESKRKEMLKQWAEYLDSHEERIERAKEALGDKWLLHPANRISRRETPFGERAK